MKAFCRRMTMSSAKRRVLCKSTCAYMLGFCLIFVPSIRFALLDHPVMPQEKATSTCISSMPSLVALPLSIVFSETSVLKGTSPGQTVGGKVLATAYFLLLVGATCLLAAVALPWLLPWPIALTVVTSCLLAGMARLRARHPVATTGCLKACILWIMIAYHDYPRKLEHVHCVPYISLSYLKMCFMGCMISLVCNVVLFPTWGNSGLTECVLEGLVSASNLLQAIRDVALLPRQDIGQDRVKRREALMANVKACRRQFIRITERMHVARKEISYIGPQQVCLVTGEGLALVIRLRILLRHLMTMAIVLHSNSNVIALNMDFDEDDITCNAGGGIPAPQFERFEAALAMVFERAMGSIRHVYEQIQPNGIESLDHLFPGLSAGPVKLTLDTQDHVVDMVHHPSHKLSYEEAMEILIDMERSILIRQYLTTPHPNETHSCVSTPSRRPSMVTDNSNAARSLHEAHVQGIPQLSQGESQTVSANLECQEAGKDSLSGLSLTYYLCLHLRAFVEEEWANGSFSRDSIMHSDYPIVYVPFLHRRPRTFTTPLWQHLWCPNNDVKTGKDTDMPATQPKKRTDTSKRHRFALFLHRQFVYSTSNRYAFRLSILAGFILMFAIFPTQLTTHTTSPNGLKTTSDYFHAWRLEWSAISMVVVLSPTLGASTLAMTHRILGTMIGSLWYCLVAMLILFPHLRDPLISHATSFKLHADEPIRHHLHADDPSATVGYLMLSLFTIMYVALCFGVKERFKSIANVALVTYTALLFNNIADLLGTCTVRPTSRTESLGDFRQLHEDFQDTFRQMMAIFGGVVAALLGSLLIYPNYARTSLRKLLAQDVVSRIGAYMEETLKQLATTPMKRYEAFTSMPYSQNDFEIQYALMHSSKLIRYAGNEPRLVGPFPTPKYERIVQRCQVILDRLLSMHIVMQHQRKDGASKETLSVLAHVPSSNRFSSSTSASCLTWNAMVQHQSNTLSHQQSATHRSDMLSCDAIRLETLFEEYQETDISSGTESETSSIPPPTTETLTMCAKREQQDMVDSMLMYIYIIFGSLHSKTPLPPTLPDLQGARQAYEQKWQKVLVTYIQRGGFATSNVPNPMVMDVLTNVIGFAPMIKEIFSELHELSEDVRSLFADESSSVMKQNIVMPQHVSSNFTCSSAGPSFPQFTVPGGLSSIVAPSIETIFEK